MTRARRRTVIPSLLFLLALAVPASASAKVICVNQSGGNCDPTNTYIHVQDAVDNASNGDTIKIRAGTYLESVNAGTKTLTFLGAGPSTIIQGGDGDNTPVAPKPALTTPHGGTVRTLKLVGGRKLEPGGTAAPGVSFASTGDFSLTLDRVTTTGGSAPGGSGDGGVGVDVSNGNNVGNVTSLAVRSSTVSGGEGSAAGGGHGLTSSAARGRISVADSTLVGAAQSASVGDGIELSNGASATLARSSVRGKAGVSLNHSTLLAVRSRMAGNNGSNGFATGIILGTSGSGAGNTSARATVVDSLVTVSGAGSPPLVPSAAAYLSPTDAAVSLSARGSTFVAPLAGRGAIYATRSGSEPASAATLRNSIARTVGGQPGSADLRADGGTIGADYSSFSTRVVAAGGSATAPGSAHNIAGDPRLASNLALLATSPLIERGDSSIVGPGELDLAGAPRALDANNDCLVRPDIGAFERPGGRGCSATPGAPNVAPRVSSFGMTNKVFAPVSKHGKAARRRKRTVKRGTRFRYRLSEAGKVRITIERKLKGRRLKRKGKKARCVSPRRKYRKKRRCTRYKRVGRLSGTKKAGRQSTRFTGRFRGRALKRGRYRATIVVTDGAGARSKRRRVSFRIVKPR